MSDDNNIERLGTFDGIDYFASPISAPPGSSAKYSGIKRLINCFGQSTLVAEFETDGVHNGRKFSIESHFGKSALKSNDENNPDAAKALSELLMAESAVKADPKVLGQFPSAGGEEASPKFCPARDRSKLSTKASVVPTS